MATKKSEGNPVTFFNTKKDKEDYEAKIVLDIIKDISVRANHKDEIITLVFLLVAGLT